MPEARPYQPADRDACLAILHARGLGDRQPEFERALDAARFTVLDHEGQILGCGGMEAGGDGVTRLVWGMVDPRWERHGLGRLLLLARMRQTATEFVDVQPPAEYAAFYEKSGFRPGPDGTLRRRLQVCG